MHFSNRRESVDGDESFYGRSLKGRMESNGEAPGEPGIGTNNALEEVPL